MSDYSSERSRDRIYKRKEWENKTSQNYLQRLKHRASKGDKDAEYELRKLNRRAPRNFPGEIEDVIAILQANSYYNLSEMEIEDLASGLAEKDEERARGNPDFDVIRMQNKDEYIIERLEYLMGLIENQIALSLLIEEKEEEYKEENEITRLSKKEKQQIEQEAREELENDLFERAEHDYEDYENEVIYDYAIDVSDYKYANYVAEITRIIERYRDRIDGAIRELRDLEIENANDYLDEAKDIEELDPERLVLDTYGEKLPDLTDIVKRHKESKYDA